MIAVDGDFVEIVAERHSACGGCSAKGGCGTALLAGWLSRRRLVFHLRNDVGAQVGDTVVVGLDEGYLQRAALVLYLLPLTGLLLGAPIGERLFTALRWSPELGAVLVGLLGLIAALAVARRTGRQAERRGEAGVRLLSIARPALAISPAQPR